MSSWIEVLAFHQRAFGRVLGRPGSWAEHPMVDVSRRSRLILEGLAAPKDSLRFKLAVAQLPSSRDLFFHELGLDGHALPVQVRVAELAQESAEVERFVRRWLNDEPSGKVIVQTLRRAAEDGVQEICLSFEEGVGQVTPVRFRKDSIWSEYGKLPLELKDSFLGVLRLYDAAGFGAIRRYLTEPHGLPENLTFTWDGADRVSVLVGISLP